LDLPETALLKEVSEEDGGLKRGADNYLNHAAMEYLSLSKSLEMLKLKKESPVLFAGKFELLQHQVTGSVMMLALERRAWCWS
jgi:hypothetical protein